MMPMLVMVIPIPIDRETSQEGKKKKKRISKMKKEETRELISSLVLIFIQECMLQRKTPPCVDSLLCIHSLLYLRSPWLGD